MEGTNPARLYEADAIATVRAWVGDRGTVVDLSDTGGRDFRIDYRDGGVGIGEIAWDTDQAERSLAAALARHAQPLRLGQGAGTWTVTLTETARAKRVPDVLPGLIGALVAAGRRSWNQYQRGVPAVDDALLALGASMVDRHTDDPAGDQVFVHPQTQVEWINEDPNCVVEWVDARLAGRFAHKISKIQQESAAERHVFLVAGDAAPMSVDRGLRVTGVLLPSTRPAAPPGVTHIWACSQITAIDHVALWTASGGWTAVPAQRA